MRFGSDIGCCSCIDAEAPEGIEGGRRGSNRTCSVLYFLASRSCSTKDGGEVDELVGDRSCMCRSEEGLRITSDAKSGDTDLDQVYS
jgi:hypothetical protein